MKIVIAPNAFKNSLDAASAAAAIRAGLERSRLVADLLEFPVGDGGDGTAALLVRHLGGHWVPADVHDPLGRTIPACVGLVDDGRTAIIEMADASGLRLLQPHEYDPLRTSSRGTGELIRKALDLGAGQILLCIGGSATVDGGMGILQALGARFSDDQGAPLEATPLSGERMAGIDLADLDGRIFHTHLTILCDVDNPLLGPHGAAHVFGPQKGAGPAAVSYLESVLSRLSQLVQQRTGKDIRSIKGGGAAGGVAACLQAICNATLLGGAEYFLEKTRFDDALRQADLVITGEGSIDKQTLRGKGPWAVASMAKARSIPVIGLAGNIPRDDDSDLGMLFDVLLPINSGGTLPAAALAGTRENLFRTAYNLGNLISIAGLSASNTR